MVQVMIRLQNHGRKNHPYWWIVVQPKNKHFQGRYIERVGIWAPRKTKTVDRMISLNSYKIKYWLSVGATPTDSVERLFHFAGLMPRKPIPFGSSSVYPQKTKPYPFQYFHKHRWGLQEQRSQNIHHYEKLKQMEALLKTKLAMDNEAINEMVRPRDLSFEHLNEKSESINYNTDMNTDDINSDDWDFYSRKRNFDIISKKMNKYFDTKYAMYKGNDYKYFNYLRKLEKLSKHESLDYEGFKEYLNAVNSLNESKNKALESIGQHYLNELLSKQSLQKEIDELIKLAKVNENENKEEKAAKNKEHLKRSADKDTSGLLEALNVGFKLAAKEVFKVNPDESFVNTDFQDIKNLRIAKILIKLRYAILNSEKRAEFLKGDNKDTPSETSTNTSNKHSFFTSIFENLKASSPLDIPVFDKDLVYKILNQHSNPENYDEMLFKNINNYLLSTETFNKFKPLLFDSDFYGNENLSSEEKKMILENPNIYLLNNDIIDELIDTLMDKLRKKYEVNEIYRDEEKDLAKFEKDELGLIKRRDEMESKYQQLKKKYGDINLLYDDYQGKSEQMKADIRAFKQEYEDELEGKFDVKFKRDLRIERPEMKVGRYDTPESVEQEKAREEKFEMIRERVMKEIMEKKKGVISPPETEKKEEKPEELTDEEKAYEQYLRFHLGMNYLGAEDPMHKILFVPEGERPMINLDPVFRIFKYKYKKQTKHPQQDEVLTLNKRRLRQNIIFVHSVQKYRAIPKARQIEMKKRFEEYFGKYNEIMYPEGFRHYENFEAYRAVFPNKAMIDYQTELNSLCDFDTFVLVSYGLINQYKKLGLIGLEFPEMFDRAQFLSLYMKSRNTEFISSILKKAYKQFIELFEKKGGRFCLIDALEQSSAVNLSHKLIPEIKDLLDKEIETELNDRGQTTQLVLRQFPNLQERGEDLGLSRMGPFMPINPLKAHKANPSFNTPKQVKTGKVRMSYARTRLYKGFCTVTRNGYNFQH